MGLRETKIIEFRSKGVAAGPDIKENSDLKKEENRMMALLNLKTLEVLRYDDDWVEIDEGIVDIIATLNRKGYITKACCEGHLCDRMFRQVYCGGEDDEGVQNVTIISYDDPYIAFAPDIELPDAPEGWAIDNRLVDAPEANECGVVIRANRRCSSEEEFEKKRAEYIASLRAWAGGLPEHKKS